MTDDETGMAWCCICGLAANPLSMALVARGGDAGYAHETCAKRQFQIKDEGPAAPEEEMSKETTKDSIAEAAKAMFNNVKEGAKIGGAGEATLLCLSTAESIVGHELTIPGIANLALQEVAREAVGVLVLKAIAHVLGGEEHRVVSNVVRLAEIDIGVRAAHAAGPQVRAKVREFMARAKSLSLDAG